MSLPLASGCLTAQTESARPPALRRGAMHLLALARRMRPTGVIRAMVTSERLSAADLRDLGLSAEQVRPLAERIRQVPIWDRGGIMWRP